MASYCFHGLWNRFTVILDASSFPPAVIVVVALKMMGSYPFGMVLVHHGWKRLDLMYPSMDCNHQVSSIRNQKHFWKDYSMDSTSEDGDHASVIHHCSCHFLPS